MGRALDEYWSIRFSMKPDRLSRLMILCVLALVLCALLLRDKNALLTQVASSLHSMSETLVVAIISSATTFVGFWIAFSVSHSTWRAQMLAQIQTSASNAIASTLTEIDGELRNVTQYIDEYQRITAELHFTGGIILEETKREIVWLIDDHDEIEASRQALKDSWKKLMKVIREHETALDSTEVGSKSFEKLIEGYWQLWRASRFDILDGHFGVNEAVAHLRNSSSASMQEFAKKAKVLSDISWAMVFDLRQQSSKHIIGRTPWLKQRQQRALESKLSELLDSR